MRYLPLDRRGLPGPVIVMRDNDDVPIFAANDEVERQRVIRDDLCQICGGRLLRGKWYVGGQLSVCAEHGLNLDSPMHDECCHYALKVCPYLAAPRYRLIGEAMAEQRGIFTIKTGTEQNDRPELFVAVMAVGEPEQRRSGAWVLGEHTYGVRPKLGTIRKVELWRHGWPVPPTPEISSDIIAACWAAGDDIRD